MGYWVSEWHLVLHIDNESYKHGSTKALNCLHNAEILTILNANNRNRILNDTLSLSIIMVYSESRFFIQNFLCKCVCSVFELPCMHDRVECDCLQESWVKMK